MSDRSIKYPAMSTARLKMLYEPGTLYAAYSRYCDWIKVGFTSKGATVRRDGIAKQYPDFAPFFLIGTTQSTWRAEQQLHRLMAPFRRGMKASTAELYPAVPAVVEMVKLVVGAPTWGLVELDRHRRIREWVRARAAHPLNRVLANESFSLFFEERLAAAKADNGGPIPSFLRGPSPSNRTRAS